MLSSSSAPPEITSARCVSVRFEDACVLIPPSCRVPSKSPLRPRIITKSYSLPLWKSSSPKKVVNDSQSLAPQEANEIVNPETERKAFSLTVSVPSLTTKSRPRRPSLPLPSPCLSRRNLGFPQSPDSETPPASPLSPLAASTSIASPSITHRTHAFPGIQPAALKEVETVPLRPCCETCHSCVDAALAEGERWSERWSSGAMRRYTEGEHVHLHVPCPSVFDVTSAWTAKSVCDDADGDIPLKDALTIDEIDVKRRSDDYSRALLNHHIPPPATQEVIQDTESDDEAVTQEIISAERVVPPILTALLQEEDEDMLFPLPSPRCTPNQSPSLTPTGSQVHLPAIPSIPSGSQTNLVIPAASSPLAPSQVIRTSAPPARLPTPTRPPLSAPVPSTEPAPDSSPPRSMSSSPVHRRQQRLSSPRRAQPRRSSFSTASETLLKGSAAILKGVATGITGSGIH